MGMESSIQVLLKCPMLDTVSATGEPKHNPVDLGHSSQWVDGDKYAKSARKSLLPGWIERPETNDYFNESAEEVRPESERPGLRFPRGTRCRCPKQMQIVKVRAKAKALGTRHGRRLVVLER